MFLEIELPGIETPSVTERGELPGREDRFQEFASREGEQLSDICCDSNAGLTNAKELVDETSETVDQQTCAGMPSVRQDSENAIVIDIPGCNEDCSDKPSTEGARRHCGIVVVIDHSTNLGVRGVLER